MKQQTMQKNLYIDSKTYSPYNSILKSCMGKANKHPKYFFYPRITKEWKQGGILVVGINHWCVQKGCPNFEDCVSKYNSKAYNKKCDWAISEVDDVTPYDLKYNTYEAFNCYLEGFAGYESFKEFLLYILGIQDCIEPEDQKKEWDKLAFYNYIQHYTKMSLTHTNSYGVKDELSIKEDEDFEAFMDVLHDLKPKLVIIWHKAIKELVLKKISEGKLQKGQLLQMVDDLGNPTRSMYRFVYSENNDNNNKQGNYAYAKAIDDFKTKHGDFAGFSNEQVILRLLRWNMFKTEENLALLTELPISWKENKLSDMMSDLEDYTWDSEFLTFLVDRIQQQLNISKVIAAIPYKRLHCKEKSIIFSNVMLQNQRNIEVNPIIGFYPEECSQYSLKKYKEKNLLSLAGVSFNGLRSKETKDNTKIGYGFILYIDENHPIPETLLKHLFEGNFEGDGYSMLIMKCSIENDKRFSKCILQSNRVYSIGSEIIEGVHYLFITLINKEREVQNSKTLIKFLDTSQRLAYKKTYSLIPKLQNSKSKKEEETETQKQANKKLMSKYVETEIKNDVLIRNNLIKKLDFAYRSGIIYIESDGKPSYNKDFGSQALLRYFCYQLYEELSRNAKPKKKVSQIIEKILGFKDANHTSQKGAKEIFDKNEYECKLIKNCIKSKNLTAFEENLKRLRT